MNLNLSTIVKQKQQFIKLSILCLFASLLYIIRVPYGLISDDALVAPTVTIQTLLENFLFRWNYNGRIFTDVLANVFYRMPIIIWKLFDVLVYIRMVLLLSRVFTKNSWLDLLVVCELVLLFPMGYLTSAGYIASTTNYVYPVACLLEIAYFLSLISHGKHISIIRYPFLLICVLYVTNHDQSGMVLIGGLLLYLIYGIILKENKHIIVNTAFLLGISVASYIFMFFIPGHIYRMSDTSEMMHWLPQYASWSFAKKIYHGFSTTVANFLFSDIKLFVILSLLIFMLALRQQAYYKKIIAFIPLVVILISNFIGTDKFVIFFEYSCGMPDLLPLSKSLMPFLITVISVCSIFYTVWSCVENKQNKWLILMLLVLAAGSREMMGLSATIYASSFRTFTFFLYSSIACCLIILQELKSYEKNGLWYLGLGAIAAMAIL